jgi:hypothetical protein
MFTRFLNFVIACFVLAILALFARAAEPPKSECPKECEMRAKAAFAFAKEKAKAEAKAATTTAPAPKPKTAEPKKVGCICGDNCPCAAGDCPAKCPVASGIAAVGKLTPPKPVVVVRAQHYERRCFNGSCYWVLVDD